MSKQTVTPPFCACGLNFFLIMVVQDGWEKLVKREP